MNTLFLWSAALCGVIISMSYSSVSCLLASEVNSSTDVKADAVKDTKEKNQKNLIQAIIKSLPKSCKEDIELCSFSFDKIESYECVFRELNGASGNGKYVKSLAKIMIYLKQLEKAELVKGFAKMWIKAREWGPMKQDVIKSDLADVLALARKSKSKGNDSVTSEGDDNKDTVKIEASHVMDCFEVLLKSEDILIASSPDWYDVSMKAIQTKSLTTRISSKSDSEFVKVIVNAFFYIGGNGNKSIQALNQSLSTKVMGKIERGLEKGKIDLKVWERYGDLLQREINDKCGTSLMVAVAGDGSKSKKLKKSKKNNSSESSEESSVSDSDVIPLNKTTLAKTVVKVSKLSSKANNNGKNKDVLKMESKKNPENVLAGKRRATANTGDSKDYNQYRNFGLAVGAGAGVLVVILWAIAFFFLRDNKGSKAAVTDL